jgi:hypothetical protein
MLLGLALGAAGYAILHPGGLEGRIPPIPLGPFEPLDTFVAAAAAGFGLVIFIAALMPKGPGGPSGGGGGKRKVSKSGQPIVIDFTSDHSTPAAADHGAPHAAHAPEPVVAAHAPPPDPAPAETAHHPEAHAAPDPHQHAPAPPQAVGAFAEARQALRDETRAEHWSQAAVLVRRLSSLAATDRERMQAAQDAGDFARSQGKTDDAAEAYDEALAYARKLGDKAALADALINVGDMAYDEHRLDQAVQAYDEVVDLRRAMVSAAPADLEAKRGLSLALERLADVREDRGHRMRALDLYRESMVITTKLASADPARFADDLAITRRRLGELEAKVAL